MLAPATATTFGTARAILAVGTVRSTATFATLRLHNSVGASSSTATWETRVLFDTVCTKGGTTTLRAPRASLVMFAICGPSAFVTVSMLFVVDAPFDKSCTIVHVQCLVAHLKNFTLDTVLIWHRLGSAVVVNNLGQVYHVVTDNYQS